MKVPFALLGILLASQSIACTYDRADQDLKLRQLAGRVHGELDAAAQTVRWQADGRKYTVVYGGCDHLGHRVEMVSAGQALSDSQLLDQARELAQAYWPPGESALLMRALESGQWTRENTGAGLRLDITGTDYSEMYVQTRVAEGSVTVEIAWVRDF